MKGEIKFMGVQLAPIKKGTRKKAEQMVYNVMNKLDPSGINTKKYKELFATMTDAAFNKFMISMWEDDSMNFTLDIVDYERDLTIDMVEDAANELGIPLEEYVIMPFVNMDRDRPEVSKCKYITMYIVDKRMQQMTQKKNSTSIHISNRSATTGQVDGDDKNGRSSDIENAALISVGAINSARELNGFRADGLQRKNKAYSDIMTKGYVSLEDVEASAGIDDRTVLNTIDTFYLGMGIKTDLIDDSLILNKTIKEL